MDTELHNPESGTSAPSEIQAPPPAAAVPQPTAELEVRFRCPHCQKLYRTSHDVFEGQDPEFDCASCGKAFLLQPRQDSFGLYVTAAELQPRFDTCPKCSGLKPHKSDECPNCGVFASKYLELQKLESPALFELNQLWQKVMQAFDQDERHQEFLNQCHRKTALNFAFQKYTDLQKTIGYDALCSKYLRQIELRLEQQLKALLPSGEDRTAEKSAGAPPLSWMQWIFMGIGAVGMLALIYNRFVPTFPNFNGLVMMLTVLAFGIGLFSNSKTGLKF